MNILKEIIIKTLKLSEAKDVSDVQRKFIKSLSNEITRLDSGLYYHNVFIINLESCFTLETSTIMKELLRTKKTLKKRLNRNIEK